ncbi:LemA family protein [Pseudomonas aeruginosa]
MSENYPQLKANQAFQDLRAQLEGTENCITVARGRYVKAVQDYKRAHAQLPDQHHGQAVQLRRQAQFLGRRREGHGGRRHRSISAPRHRRRAPDMRTPRTVVLSGGPSSAGPRSGLAAAEPVPFGRVRAGVGRRSSAAGARHRSHGNARRRSVAALDAQLRAFEQRKGVQIAVLMVRSTRPEPVEQYALRVVEQWKPRPSQGGRRRVAPGGQGRPHRAHRSRITASRVR